ncbi:hypothetical protein ACH4FX_31745 [Streptomyces sp. NPDC018019]|uniref:hypothetical protein n=1 Tax=Streptomyces sp. NPDC018019 TaxID=3365030 RepID=UPI0037B5755B
MRGNIAMLWPAATARIPHQGWVVTKRMNRTYAITCLALLTVGAAAAPASAGGILPIASPAFGNSCANRGAPHATGTTAHGTGTGDGNLAGLPISGPSNHCGSADFSGGALNGLTNGLGALTG